MLGSRFSGEICGRWSAETIAFVSQLAKARSREEIPLMQLRVETSMATPVGFYARVCLCEGCHFFSLEPRRPHGADGEGPSSHEVDAEFWHAGLA